MAAITGQYRSSPLTYSNLDVVDPLPTDVNGNLMVNIASGESINIGTMTVGTIDMLRAGTLNAGTINAGTINSGTINAATINAGTIGTVANIGTINSGTINAATAIVTNGSIVVTAATISAGTMQLSGTPNIGTLNAATVNAATINTGTINVATVNAATINAGTMSMPIIYQLATVNVGSGKIAGTLTNTFNGIVYKITQAVGTLAGTPGTITTQLVDDLGGTIASLTAQAESSTATYSTIVPLDGNMKWITTATDADGGTQTAAAGVDVTLALHYQK